MDGDQSVFYYYIFAIVGYALDHACESARKKRPSRRRSRRDAGISDRLARAICEIPRSPVPGEGRGKRLVSRASPASRMYAITREIPPCGLAIDIAKRSGNASWDLSMLVKMRQNVPFT